MGGWKEGRGIKCFLLSLFRPTTFLAMPSFKTPIDRINGAICMHKRYIFTGAASPDADISRNEKEVYRLCESYYAYSLSDD